MSDSKFRPNPNGFSFQNLLKPSQTFPSGPLGVEEMRRLFGDQACASMVGGCTLTPAVEKFRTLANKDLDGGLCEGFAILANIFYAGANGMKPSDFQAGATSTFDLKISGNPKLERELVYWMITQYLVTTPAGDHYVIELRVTGDTTGQKVTLTLDQTKGKLKVQVDGHDTADYDIELVVHRIGVKGDERFAHTRDTNINIPSGSSFEILYGSWAGNGNAAYLEVDNNRDGTPDRGIGLGDED